MDLLRFITAGSVDDGKSTLIGRLLHDTHSIKLDELKTIQRQSKKNGEIDLALFTDGLRAEREQGITIDVAYKYFQTAHKKFIIADAPGHIQYTRNMVTGASNSHAIIILIDARHGVVEQTRRHSIIASLLKIPHITVAINKMDMVNYREDRFHSIVEDYMRAVRDLQLKQVTFIPVSALQGDNVVFPSNYMQWYGGKTLLHHLENINGSDDPTFTHARFQVQYVIRPQQSKLQDYRGYAGRVISGEYHIGQKVIILPEGIQSTLEAIEIHGQEVSRATVSQNIVMRLRDNIDISRGDVIVAENNRPKVTSDIQATLCWMDTTPLQTDKKYLLQIGSRIVHAIIKEIEYKIDVNTLEKKMDVKQINLNDILRVTCKTSAPVVYDSYQELRSNGAAILIDEMSHNTVAGCMLE